MRASAHKFDSGIPLLRDRIDISPRKKGESQRTRTPEAGRTRVCDLPEKSPEDSVHLTHGGGCGHDNVASSTRAFATEGDKRTARKRMVLGEA